ncbi:MAG TPA: sigma 54-interacting transcriptional regulator, partial [Kofleriaceae bacterium]|nr:sigma 54-interacting transcriptional regulator [Kofleriaceae bacterium]
MASDRTTAASPIIGDDGGERSSDGVFLVVYGEDPAGSLGTRVLGLPDGAVVTVGRLDSNTLAVQSDQVSRHHARITRRGPEVLVEDVGSRNGTRVNGNLIAGPTRVSSGDEIAIGPLVAIVSLTARVRRQATVGSTTELDDRLGAELDRARRYRRPLGLVMIRLAGEPQAQSAALDRVGKRLRRMDFLAQYGPDEFAILFPEADEQATFSAARRLVADARKADEPAGVAVHLGMAVFPDHGATTGELLSRARAALRTARAGGGSGGVSSAPREEMPAHVVVSDPSMERVLGLARRVAATPMTVLILGETGVGKEIVATTIHRMSPRADKPFVALNCSALPETLLESLLFGHERGAFTGADRRHVGYFEAASGGTIFLDEIGEIPLALQPKLLRVLEQRAITRVGGTQSIPVDVRVICATHRDLEGEVRRQRFRDDLFFRLSGFTLAVPPLRQRRLDIVPLAQQFARQFALELGQPPAVFSPEVIEVFERYEWPGNVRQLRNAVERAVVLAPGGTIGPDDLPDEMRRAPVERTD